MTSIFHHPYCKPFIRHPFESIKCFFISLKWAYQRIKKGYCDQDLIYGVENWLLEMLPEVVDEIKMEDYGVPLEIYDDAVESFGLNIEEYRSCDSDLFKKYHEQVDAESKKRWQDILSRISFLLKETVDWKCSKKNPYEEEYSKVKLNNPEYKEIQRRYYEEDNKLEEYRDQCKKEAVELLLTWSHYMEI